ncbi:RNA polymerase factor sigma-54 [Clostridium sp. Marseille-QA1073]
MSLNFDLKLTMEQKLIMTMEMQLSVKLLQMSSYDLLKHINNELEENIVLEAKPQENDEVRKEEVDYSKLIKHLENDNKTFEYGYKDEEVSPLNFVSAKKSLKDFLKEQLIEINLKRPMIDLCNYMVECIDKRGYLDTSLDQIAKIKKQSLEYCEKALEIIQDLEPVGIGARDLKECLKIQLKRKKLGNSYIYEIVDEYLELVSKNKYNDIAKKLKIDSKTVQDYVDIIKTLEPKPARGYFTGEEISYIIPDATIRRIEDDFIIIMNDSILPKLNVNTVYKEILNNSEEKEVVDYVKEKMNKAMFLIKSIDERRNTLYKVIEEIISLQKSYFMYGEDYLKPMTIKNVADNINFHESTISRAIKDKYIALHTGKVIKIKDLFTNSLNTMNDDISTNNIKKKIKEIIDGENKKKPFSDSAICNMLNNEGIMISRRTIAKYREQLGIFSSSQRKRL